VNRLFISILGGLIGLLLLVHSTAAQNTQTVRNDGSDLVHFGDVVEVDVVGSFEFDWRGTLNGDGFLAGYDAYDSPIRAACRSEVEIAEDVTKALSKILRAPKVDVKIIDRSGRALARLEGAVRTPTRFMIRRPAHLRELLVLAGGIAEGADGSITILRRSDLGCTNVTGALANGSQTINITVSDLLKGAKDSDPEIKSGDFVTVAKAQPVYIVGGLNNLSPLYVRSDLTVSRAVGVAGGLIKNADPSRVSVYRREKGELKIIDLDLVKIAKGDQKDEILKPFDILEVALKGGEKRKFPPAAPYNVPRSSSGELPLRIIE
jgi:protein involved in polysaccharide export with SLBB domain